MTSAIILAGGLGTRLRSVVPDLPKPMAPINGRPFLEWQMDYWIRQGVSEFILSVGYRHEVIQNHFGNSYCGASISYVVESTPLGTGGGLILAMQKETAPVLVLNGDTFFDVNLHNFIKFHEANRSDWTFALFRAGEEGRYGSVDMDDCGRIHGFDKNAQINSLANGGVYFVKPTILQNLRFQTNNLISLENDLLPALLSEGARLFGMECNANLLDIGVPEDYQRAGEFLIKQC